MENKDATDWKKKYKEQERLFVNLMTDLDNYRSLVHRLKAEINTLHNNLDYSEKRAEKLEQDFLRTLYKETLDEYYYTFQN